MLNDKPFISNLLLVTKEKRFHSATPIIFHLKRNWANMYLTKIR